MKRRRLLELFGLSTLAFLLPGGRAVGARHTLTFKGCSIVRRAFMSEAAAAYEKATGSKIVVMGGGATLGIRAAAAGDADIGGACRPALPERFPEEQGVAMVHVAWDALVFITHPSNPVDGITLAEAKELLLGETTNWKEIGGRDARIITVLRSQVPEHGGKVSGVGYMTRLMLFDDPETDFSRKATFFRHSAEVEETTEVVETSFAVTGISSAQKRKVKILELEGVAPTKENIASGRYPWFRPLYLIVPNNPPDEVRGFVDWILGDEGQAVISAQGTVNLAEGRILDEKFRHWPERDLFTNR